MLSIPAECHSDDNVCECKFDAIRWFRKATSKDIIALASIGWGGDYAADKIAEFMEDVDADVKFMFQYIRKRDDQGFECHVDKEAALNWLRANKPKIYEALDCLELTED